MLTRIRTAAKAERFNRELLNAWGFTASNDRAIISVLRGLGFIAEGGAPTGEPVLALARKPYEPLAMLLAATDSALRHCTGPADPPASHLRIDPAGFPVLSRPHAPR